MKNLVIAVLPRYGLCNRLFIWANGVVFAELNSLKLYVNGWYKTPIGPWLRNERVKRFYSLYFNHSTNILGLFIRTAFLNSKCVKNPSLSTILNPPIKNNTYVFNKMPNKTEYFLDLKEHKSTIKTALYSSLSKKVLRELSSFNNEKKIGVHIRLGDFITINKAQKLTYYIDAINFVRKEFNNLPVKIFTDGYEEQIKEVMKLGNVALANNKTDIADLLELSTCDIIITTLDSTFSYWAAFLSDAIILHPLNYNHVALTDRDIITLDQFKIEK